MAEHPKRAGIIPINHFEDAPKSQEARKGEQRRMALTIRHRAITSDEIVSPIVSIAIIELPGPADKKPFMKERFGIKK